MKITKMQYDQYHNCSRRIRVSFKVRNSVRVRVMVRFRVRFRVCSRI